jgi:hypothetical protein
MGGIFGRICRRGFTYANRLGQKSYVAENLQARGPTYVFGVGNFPYVGRNLQARIYVRPSTVRITRTSVRGARGHFGKIDGGEILCT